MDIGRQNTFHQLRGTAVQRLALCIAVADVADAGIQQTARNEHSASRIGDDVRNGNIKETFFAHRAIRITWLADQPNPFADQYTAP